MEISIDNIKITHSTETLEFEFPLYRWYSQHKSRIIKVYPEYYNILKSRKMLKNIVIITVDTNSDVRISTERLSVQNNIVDQKFNQWLRDYSLEATREEFLKMRNTAIKALFGEL